VRKLPSVQNAADARLITNTFDNITPVLRNLYWLPFRQEIVFKTAMIVYDKLTKRPGLTGTVPV